MGSTARTRTQKLTDEFVRKAKTPAGAASAWYSDGEADRDLGQLYLRVMPGGTKTYYFRYATGERRRGTVKIGRAGPDGMALADARLERDRLRRQRQTQGRDLSEVIRREKAAKRAAEEAAKLESEKTLKALVTHYWEHLEAQGKAAWRDVRSVLTKNLIEHEKFSKLAKRPAAEIEPGEIATVTRSVSDEGHKRTAAKLRSFLAAAYSLALRAETDAAAPAKMLGFKLSGNPAQATAAIAGNVRDRHLDAIELGAVLRAVAALPDGPVRAAIQLQLLLGGQRHTQLVRVPLADVDIAARRVTIDDPKGKRKSPRRHTLPLTDTALAIVKQQMARSAELKSKWLFAFNLDRPLGSFDLSRAVQPISAALVKAGQLKEKFEIRDLRRTTETMLADLGVSKDIRAQILSHGLSGVQARHYDRAEYAAEKLAALTLWEKRLAELEKAAPTAPAIAPLPKRSRKRAAKKAK